MIKFEFYDEKDMKLLADEGCRGLYYWRFTGICILNRWRVGFINGRLKKQQPQTNEDPENEEDQMTRSIEHMTREDLLILVKRLNADYYDLIYTVKYKHPGESRHGTAKRYIIEAEESTPIEAKTPR